MEQTTAFVATAELTHIRAGQTEPELIADQDAPEAQDQED